MTKWSAPAKWTVLEEPPKIGRRVRSVGRVGASGTNRVTSPTSDNSNQALEYVRNPRAGLDEQDLGALAVKVVGAYEGDRSRSVRV